MYDIAAVRAQFPALEAGSAHFDGSAALADLLGADPAAVVFGRSATQLAYDFSRTLAKTWTPGAEVVVSRLDHDANIRPWAHAAAVVGATVRWADFDRRPGS